MSRFIYTPEMLKFISKKFKKHGVAEVAAAFNAKFGTEKTTAQIKATITNHGIKCGRTKGEMNKGAFRAFTVEQAAFIRKQYQRLSLQMLTEAFNKKFNASKTVAQLRAFTRNHSVKSGRTGQFEKGQPTWNAGKKGWTAGGRSAETRFKKGHQCAETKPVGATRVCSKDGYVMIKVAMPNQWQLKHIVEWEKHHGPVPKGHRLWFKDNDRTNWNIDNLMLITRAQGAVINKQGFGTVPAEYKVTAVALADLAMKRRQLVKAGVLNV